MSTLPLRDILNKLHDDTGYVMTHNEARAAIMLRVLNSGIFPGGTLDIDNGATFTVPTQDVPLWGRLTIRFNGENQTSLGGSGVCTKFTNYGIATVQIFTPINLGEYANDEAARQVRDLFRKQTGDRPLYYGGTPAGGDVRVENVGRDGAWWQSNVVVPVWFDEVVA